MQEAVLMTVPWPKLKLGAHWQAAAGYTDYLLWAPQAKAVHIKVAAEQEYTTAMQAHSEAGYWHHRCARSRPGTLYSFATDPASGNFLPDPASRHQPHGVHGPSAVAASEFAWTDDAWSGVALESLVIYELHAGTFSEAGSFAGVIPYLEELKRLGITAIELMPVAQFPGQRNWGYDGVLPFAAQDSYGGVAGLKALVNRCHELGLGVILDVVYNHLGPEGNYLGSYGPYFQDRYKTPWGLAINFDGSDSDGVRRYFIENALQWLDEFHIDALRLDAVHAICDLSATPFLEELAGCVQALATSRKRKLYLIAESDTNDSRLLNPRAQGGLGLDAHWCDDFHHSLHTAVTGESFGYYRDYRSKQDSLAILAKAMAQGVVFDGSYSPSRHARHGRSYRGVAPQCLVVCSQNHDQVGNRAHGERLSSLVDFARLKTVAACVLLAPFTPLLFMGEEYGETAPFLYFVDHSDEGLLAAIRDGRRQEFSEAHAGAQPPPDPGAEATFLRSHLNHSQRQGDAKARTLWHYYQRLIELSKTLRLEAQVGSYQCRTHEAERVLVTRRQITGADSGVVSCYFSFNAAPSELRLPASLRASLLLSSNDYPEGGVLDTAEAAQRYPRPVTFDKAIVLEPFEVLVLRHVP